jgi:hypothetical protein
MTHKILNILKVVAFTLPLVGIKAQVSTNVPDSLNIYVQKKHDLNRHGMIILTTWASANILSGAGYFVPASKHDQYFYAMNAAWGVVNLAIAIPGLLSKKKQYHSKGDLLKEQLKTEKVFFINGVLDLVYIGGGFALKEVSNSQSDANHQAMLSGFGDSFLLQGAGLLLFDSAMYLTNRNNRKKHLEKLLRNTQLSLNFNRMNLSFRF